MAFKHKFITDGEGNLSQFGGLYELKHLYCKIGHMDRLELEIIECNPDLDTICLKAMKNECDPFKHAFMEIGDLDMHPQNVFAIGIFVVCFLILQNLFVKFPEI